MGLGLPPARLSSSARKARIELVLLRLVTGSSRITLGLGLRLRLRLGLGLGLRLGLRLGLGLRASARAGIGVTGHG